MTVVFIIDNIPILSMFLCVAMSGLKLKTTSTKQNSNGTPINENTASCTVFEMLLVCQKF